MMFRYFLLFAVVVIALGYALPLYLSESRDLNKAALQQAPGEFAELSLGSTHYRIFGPEDGIPLVLVHGFSTPSFVWEPLLQALPQDKYRILIYDLYGRGFSARPQIDYSAEVFQQQLGEITAHAGFTKQPFTLAGYSMGGAVVARYAAEHPNSIAHLLLIAPAGYPLPKTTTTRLLKVPLLGRWLFHVVGRGSLAEDIEIAVNAQQLNPEFLFRFNRQLIYRGTLDALHSTYVHYPLSDQREYFLQLAQQQMPIGVIWGSLDQVTPYANSLLLSQDIPRSVLCSVDYGQHSVTYAMPVEVAQCLEALLQKQEVADTAPELD